MGNINTLLSLDGESEFRRQLNFINQNLKTLDKALTETAAMFANEADKMKLTSQTSQNLERQLDLLKNKQTLLNSAVSSSFKTVQDQTKKLGEAKQAYANSAIAVDQLKTQLKAAEETYGRNSQEAKKLRTELKAAEEAHRQNAKAVEDAEKKLDRATKVNQQYRQQLSDTNTQIHNTQNELARLAQQEDTETKSTQKAAESTNTFKTALSGLKSALDAAGTACAKIAQVEFRTLEATFKAIGTELELGVSGLKKYTEAVAAAGVAIGSFATSKGMSFEASMSKVEAYSKASAEDLEKLSAAAKEMGASTSKTAAEAADALGFLALNGYKTEEMLSSLKPIVKASEAGGMSLATVADAVANSLTSYGKGAEDAEEFLNVLTATQNNSATSMEQLLTTYRDLSGTFKMLDVDFNESATLLGLVANRGLKGAEAGTALNSVMLRLLGTNKNSATALKSIGVSAWDAEGNFKGLTNTLREVSAKMQDMTTEEKTLFEKEISGVMRFQEFNKLLDAANDLENYEELYNEVSHAMENNYLYNTAETMMDNLKGDITILKSATEALGISIFDTFSDKAVYNVEKMTFWVNKLNDGVKNGDLLTQLDQVAAGMSDALVQGINLASRELPSKLKVFNSAILNGVKLLIKGISKSKNTILPELITGAKDLVLGLVEQLPEFTKEVTDGAVIMFTGLVDAMFEISGKLREKMPEVLNTLLTAITEHGPYIFETGFEVLMNLINGILENLPQIMKAGQKILDKLIYGINEHIDEIIKGGLEILGALLKGITDNFDKILNTAFDLVGKLVEDLCEGDTIDQLIDAAFEIMDSLLRFMWNKLPTILEKWIPKIVSRIVNALIEHSSDMEDVGDRLGAALIRGFWSAIKGVFKIGVDTGMRGILGMFGITGENADLALDVIDRINNNIGQQANAAMMAEYGVYEQPSVNTQATSSSSPKNNTVTSDNVGLFADGSYGPVINFYSPVINNKADAERVAEQAAQLQTIANSSGGKY